MHNKVHRWSSDFKASNVEENHRHVNPVGHYGHRHGRSDLAYRGAEGLDVALGGLRGHVCVRVYVRVCVRVMCVRACVRVCERVCVRVCVRV